MRLNATQATAIAVALLGPPAICHGLSLLISHRGLDIFSVVIIELLAFSVAAKLLRSRPSSAVMVASLYLPAMFIAIFWIGMRAGYYQLP
jgi:hypothetical protein